MDEFWEKILHKIIAIIIVAIVYAILSLFLPKGINDVTKEITKVVVPAIIEKREQKNEPEINHTNQYCKYPYTSTRKLSKSDLEGKSKWELKIMRNEIFARYGYVFKKNDLNNYFNNQAWYINITKRPNIKIYDNLNKTELYNVKLIEKYEK